VALQPADRHPALGVLPAGAGREAGAPRHGLQFLGRPGVQAQGLDARAGRQPQLQRLFLMPQGQRMAAH
jgi:hypothetical protein